MNRFYLLLKNVEMRGKNEKVKSLEIMLPLDHEAFNFFLKMFKNESGDLLVER